VGDVHPMTANDRSQLEIAVSQAIRTTERALLRLGQRVFAFRTVAAKSEWPLLGRKATDARRAATWPEADGRAHQWLLAPCTGSRLLWWGPRVTRDLVSAAGPVRARIGEDARLRPYRCFVVQ
jgi:hypothetical protein